MNFLASYEYNHFTPNIKLIVLLLIISGWVRSQDMECSGPTVCNQVTLMHTVQIKTHCIFLNILFRNMSEESLSAGMFRLCRPTVILDLSNNRIRDIKAGAFLGLVSLRQLYLANNLIDRIEPGTFHTLTNLEVFVLAGNRIIEVPDYEFTSREMRFFNINNNHIKRIPQTALLYLQSAELIDLSLNDLDFLHPVTLSNVKSGVKLVLNNNHLQNLSMTFNSTSLGKQYSILEASGNLITSLNNNTLGEFYKLRLISIDLSFNYISDVHVETFDNFTTLNSLYLSHNRIKSIHPELFRMLKSLSSLDLSYNQLTNSIFDVNLPDTITAVNYSHNQISYFREYHWTSKLKRTYMYIDVSNNSIRYLDANRFCRFMYKINLAYNPWDCSVLYSVIHTLEMRGVQVESGSEFRSNNVKGIPCEVDNSKQPVIHINTDHAIHDAVKNTTETKHTHNINSIALRCFGSNLIIAALQALSFSQIF